MTTADRWTRAVRHQLGLGRILPLGGARDGAWISERAAETVLRRAADHLRGVRLDVLRIALADPDDVHDPAVPPPPSALPPGPLRVTAEFEATAAEPLPTTAALLRTTLAAAATELLGLTVAEVDLRVTALLDEEPLQGEEPEPVPAGPPEPPRAPEPGDGDEGRAAGAALSVPGVTHLTGGLGRAVHIEERHEEGALPHRHARVELAVDADHRAVEVAREVRAVVREALPDHPTVAVLVTAVG
ncbi:nucleopolyhedrovirus P10 family protein [Streptomyces sp. NBC_00005]|uniref:nucleopolyhedrovirus P10 family protein n=1 Tax=Streptomyces sp. NBC_00005 TaxID=2903609 RepID=UPI00324A5A63